MRCFKQALLIGIGLTSLFLIKVDAQKVYYVSNGGVWSNWDIYSYNIANSTETRLTTDPAIDNHPDVSHLDSNMVVFSSNRGNGEFDIYIANVNNIDLTANRLTNDSYPGIQQGKYADRHPHWHPNRPLIVFTSKNRSVYFPYVVDVVTECSEPIILIHYRYYEGINIIEVDADGNFVSYHALDMETAWDSLNPDPAIRDIWIHGDSTYIGHPSFNSQGNLMVFTAAIDGSGKNWEVYTSGFDPVGIQLIPNTLRRRTLGPNNGVNPIKMSGGAKFSNNDSLILFNSTRITNGNSQIYSIPSTAINWPVTSATRLTFHQGNDYVPQPVPNSNAILITSDLGYVPLCSCEQGLGATSDLDVVLLQGGTRTILGSDAFQSTLLISDEVSWFCGSPPNLTACRFHPRIFDVESIWLEHNNFLMPEGILGGYGSQYATSAQYLYSMGWGNLMYNLYETCMPCLDMLMNDINALTETFPWSDCSNIMNCDTVLLMNWYYTTEVLRTKKHVLPSIMHEDGLAGYSRDPTLPFGNTYTVTPVNNYLTNIQVPADCYVCHDAIDTLVIGGPGSYFIQEPMGRVNLIAGKKIRILPGTTIQCTLLDTTKDFHAWITTNGTFCYPSTKSGSPTSQFHASHSDSQVSTDNNFFKIYPNPATQSFWIELLDEKQPCKIELQVSDFSGMVLLRHTRTIVKRTQVFLNNQPPGIYFVKIIKGNQTGDQKVILN